MNKRHLARSLPAVAGVVVLCAAGPAYAAAAKSPSPAPPGTIYGCVSHSHGDTIRLVSGPGHCARGERQIALHIATVTHHRHRHPGSAGHKDTAGRRGATGPKGATGATGATGPKGATGLQGAQGISGQTGLQGPAGSYVVKDANGAVIGTLLGASATYSGNALTILRDDGTVIAADASSGHYTIPAEGFYYSGANCTGTAYLLGSFSPQQAFADGQHTNTGDPLYTTGAFVPDFTAQSYFEPYYGGSCTNLGSSTDMGSGYLPAQVGTIPANATGPLTIAQK